MVPSLNFTVRPRPFEAKLAASADAPDSAAVVALTAVNDTLRAAQYPANSRRFSDLVSSLFTVIPSTAPIALGGEVVQRLCPLCWRMRIGGCGWAVKIQSIVGARVARANVGLWGE